MSTHPPTSGEPMSAAEGRQAQAAAPRTWPISRRRRLKWAGWSGGPAVLCSHAPPVVEEEDGRLVLRSGEHHATEPFAFAAYDGKPWCAACGQPLQVFYWSGAADSWRAEGPERSAAGARLRRLDEEANR